MKYSKKCIILFLACVGLMLCSKALAQDWSEWRSSNRDSKVTGLTVPKEWPKGLIPKWEVTVPEEGTAPILVDNRLYLFARQDTNEVTLCLDAANGKQIWQDKYFAPVPVESGPPMSFLAGPFNSPAVADGKVITLGTGGIVSCLDAATGKVIWRKDEYPGTWPLQKAEMSPLLVDGLCIVRLGKHSEGVIVAYNLKTGQTKWKWTGENPVYTSPVLMSVDGAKMIITQTEKSIVAIAMDDGKLMWQYPFIAEKWPYHFTAEKPCKSSTLIVNGQTLIYTCWEQGIKALIIKKKGDIFVVEDLWSNDENSAPHNTTVLKNGLLYGRSMEGKFFCINAKTGQTAWTWTDPRTPLEYNRSCPIVDAGPVLISLTPRSPEEVLKPTGILFVNPILLHQSRLYIFEPSDKEYKELAFYPVMQSYNDPVVAGNRIFIKSFIFEGLSRRKKVGYLTLWTIE
jgi:outer membrane protein assembly factor BamB